MRLLVWLMAIVCAPGVLAQAQAPQRMDPAAHPSFEVATIRLSDPASHRQGINAEGHRVTLHGQTVTSMMMFAYGLHQDQIVGGPAWRSEDRYEVDGIADLEGEPDTAQMQEMIRTLLAQRFGLTVRREMRPMTYYAIVVGKGGAKLVKAVDADAQPNNYGSGRAGVMEMTFKTFSLPHFAMAMQYFLDRPAVDETGLPGVYDFTLRWTPGDGPSGDGPPPLFTAVQEQLGLKLEAKKGPVDVVVVDQVGRPSAN